MRKASLFIFLFISIFLLSEIPVDAARGISVISDLSHRSGKLGAYRALIIGINDYKDPKIPDLETAVNDARAMAELLGKRYGFKVKLLLNRKATRKAIYRALRNLASSTKPDDSILIYYAGHGDLDRTYDDGWWIPADAKGGDPLTYLDNVQVQKSMRSMKARHVLLISDSCYSGTLFGQARAMPQVIDDKYYLNLYNEKSRWGMTSGNKTPVSDAGTGGHSVFAYQLLKELRQNEKPYISTQEIYTRIAPIVSNNSEQMPLCRPVRGTGDQGGEFVFVASRVATVEKPAQKSLVDTTLDAERKRLEHERIELERLKIELEREKIEAERKRIEDDIKKQHKLELAKIEREKIEEKKQLELAKEETKKYASISPSVTEPDVIKPDNNFIKYDTGVVFDKKTGLEWYAGPDKDTNWKKAKYWVKKLKVAGGRWRMPTVEELKNLYQEGVGTCNMTPLFKTTAWFVWSRKTKGLSMAWGFDFGGNNEHYYPRSYSYALRGFAVRSRR